MADSDWLFLFCLWAAGGVLHFHPENMCSEEHDKVGVTISCWRYTASHAYHNINAVGISEVEKAAILKSIKVNGC